MLQYRDFHHYSHMKSMETEPESQRWEATFEPPELWHDILSPNDSFKSGSQLPDRRVVNTIRQGLKSFEGAGVTLLP
jgi:hypothetical protein